jgi:PAS domain S-box-containing protein
MNRKASKSVKEADKNVEPGAASSAQVSGPDLARDLQLLVDSTPALIHTGLPNGDLDFFNRTWLEYVGLPMEELLGWKWTACIHPDDVAGIVEKWRASLASGEPFIHEARVRRADGEHRWMLHQKVAVHDERGQIIKWHGSSIDIEDRRRAEEKVKQDEAELRELIDILPHHVLVLNPEGRILQVNQMVLDYTGRTLAEMRNLETAERIRRDIHPDDIERARGQRERSLTKGLPFEIERRALGKDGAYRWFLFRYKPLLDESGKVSRWFCTATDIEDIKRGEEELRLAVDTISAYLHTARPDGLVDFLNRRWLDYLGLPLEAALARCDVLDIRDPSELDLSSWGFHSVIHPDDVEEITAVWSRIVGTKVVEDAYARIRRSDGIYRWFLFRTCPRFDETGKLIKWYGAAIDIEDQKRAEEKLRQREIDIANQLRLVINTTPGLAWTAGPDGAADFLNQQWLEYAGLSIDEAIGWGFMVAIHPDDLPRMLEDWQRALRTGGLFETEARVRRHDGEYRRFLFRGNALRDSVGKIVKWVGIDTDVEDGRRAEDALRESEQSLRLIVDSIPGLIHAMTPSGEVEIVSQRVMDFFGKTFEELKEWTPLLHPDDYERVLAVWERSLVTGEPVDIEHRVLRSDGVYTWVHSRGHALQDSANRVIRWYYLITDIDERKRAEEKLKRSEAYLLEAQRLSHTGSFGCRTSTGEMIWSDETFRIFEYGRNTHPTVDCILQRVHPEDRPLVEEYIDRATREGKDCDFEYRLLLPDGSIKHLRLVAHAVRDESGSPEFLGAVTDITERKRAHEALRRSESYLLEGQRLAKTGSFGWDVSTRTPVYLSEEAYRIFGFDPDKGIPTWEDRRQRVHPEDQARWQEEVDRAIAEKSGYELDYRIIRPSGMMNYLHVVAHPVLSESGDLVEFTGTVMDITERWKAQEALRESEHHLRLLIEAIPALIWCAMPGEGEVVYANQRFCNYAGRTLEELLECKWITLIHPDDFETTRLSWRHALETGEPHEITHRIRRGDGEYHWFQTLAEPLRDRENRITQWYGLNIDIDDSKKMAEALRATQTRLSRATQIATVAELSASIAHEINQPLGAVVANGDACEMWLSSDPPNLERARLAVQRIVRDGNAAAEVIHRIRALFKQVVPSKAVLEMNDVIAEVIRLASNETQRKGISIESDLVLDLPRTSADRVQMQQLMINLVQNAIESMEGVTGRPKSLILRSRRSDPGAILIEVCDHGTGLENAERVFEPFFTTKEKGMGMGLSICRSIVDAHEGSLWATRNEDQGTTFSFTIPAVTEKL